MMDFLDLVNKGVEKSNKALAAVAEVDKVFSKINESLQKYPAGKLSIQRKISTLAHISSIADGIAGLSNGVAVESEYFKHDRISLTLQVNSQTVTEDVAGWKQRVMGYPCILKFDGQELTCSNEKNLLNGLSELLSSVGFGNTVNKLVKTAKEYEMKKSQNTPIEQNPPKGKLTLISDAVRDEPKSVNRPVAAKPAKKPWIGRAAQKPAAKHISSKKPATKPAASQVAKKPAAKSEASKKPTKPGISKETAKPGTPAT